MKVMTGADAPASFQAVHPSQQYQMSIDTTRIIDMTAKPVVSFECRRHKFIPCRCLSGIGNRTGFKQPRGTTEFATPEFVRYLLP